MKILVTGAAGFIGFHLSKRLLSDGHQVFGVDNLNDYYDVGLKEARLAILSKDEKFEFLRVDIADRVAMDDLFSSRRFETVYHMAAQAGVRYSVENPHAYVDSNLVGFLNVLEGCRAHCSQETHLIYASSSSVYGNNTKLPFSTGDNVDHPISLYAATKKANELMAHTYSHLYGIRTTGLRLFTVYGPWGRPDMALFKFTKKILAEEPIDVYNGGQMRRDFTYIDDVIEGVVRVGGRIQANTAYKIYNIGNNTPVGLMDFIATIEDALGKKAKLNMLPMQQGDVPETYADVDDLMRDISFAPKMPLKYGVEKFVEWYRGYYA